MRDEINAINEISDTNEINESNETNRNNETNEINGINAINDTNEINGCRSKTKGAAWPRPSLSVFLPHPDDLGHSGKITCLRPDEIDARCKSIKVDHQFTRAVQQPIILVVDHAPHRVVYLNP